MQMGLKIISIEVGEGAETIVTAEIPEKVRIEMESKTRKRKPSLVEVMRTLARRAEQDWGQVQRMELSGGLGIDLIHGIDGKLRLQIWRMGKYPAAKEWETVLAAWPEAPKGLVYRQFTHWGRWYLWGEWTDEASVQGEEGDRGIGEKGAGA